MSFITDSPVWRPFTQHGLQPGAIEIASAEGAWLESTDGKRYLDAISSWWVITHGHRRPEIMRAIRLQTERLDQLIFAGFTHEPAETLARRLLEITQPGLHYVFYSDSGSTSVEVAVKMALGYWRNRGEARARILALEHGYHGDTVGGMSTSAPSAFNASYTSLLYDVARIPFPHADREQETFDALEAACKSGAAAFVVEPLIVGAGGMLIYSTRALRAMREICARYGVLFIADEVMTGFGRTGALFACPQAGVTPDIVCLSKGLSGGALPLAVTMCSSAIFEAHLSPDRAKALFHSSSFNANPIACAAALANLDIWRDGNAQGAVTRLCALQEERIARFSNDARFENPRRIGTITALDLVAKEQGYLAPIGIELMRFFNARGLLLRPLGTTIYVLPPYCATAEDLDRVYDAIDEAGSCFSAVATPDRSS